MSDIREFIDSARQKNVDDGHIKQMLLDNGWTESQAQAGLLGLDVPRAEAPPTTVVTPMQNTQIEPLKPKRPNLDTLEAALHTVLLWVFTATSTIMIAIVATALFGSTTPSSETLITYVVMELLTFTPFLLLYLRFLKKRNQNEELGTGRIWSTLTIIFHSIGLIISLISAVLVIVLVHNDGTLGGLLGSISISIMNALVVSVYALINFVSPSQGWHKKLIKIFPALLFVLISVFAVLALVRVGPLKADDQTRQDLVSTVNMVKEYVSNNDTLPTSQTQISGMPSGIEYTRSSQTSYKLCAEFVTDGDGYDNYYDQEGRDDSYVSDYTFMQPKKGNQCWTLTSAELRETENKTDIQYFDPNSTDYDSSRTY